MHVLFLTHYFPPEVNAPASRTYEHCRRWVRSGHDVTVITCAPNCPSGVVFDGYRNAWRSEELVDGIRVIRVWSFLAANRGFLRRIMNYLSYLVTAVWCAARLRDVDVIIATTPQFFCGWAGVICHWLRRWPFVLEVRDIWPESIVAVGAMQRTAVIRMLEWLERRMYAAADQIVTVGKGYQRQLVARGVAAERIAIVPNGVDLDAFQSIRPSQPLLEKWHSAGQFVCAYVGTVGMAHGLDVVLAAAQELRNQQRHDIAFWIVGDGADRGRLEDETRRRQLDNVHFLGLVPKSEIREILATANAGLVHLRGTPLFETVIPSKIFEMMAMNVPLIVGVRGEASQHVVDADAGLAMTPDDPHSLLACLETVRRSPDAFRGGRRYVQQHFDRSALAGQLLDVLCDTSGCATRESAAQLQRDRQRPLSEGDMRKAA